MPGTDPAETARIIAGELPDFPHLAELPARGPGADLTGRTTALLVGIPAEVTPRGWKLSDRAGLDLRRARSMLSNDLDELEETLDGYAGPLKVQLAGPWTLAATLEQPRSFNRALADPGAVRDITGSLAEAAIAHLDDVGKRVPGATVVLQLDEPALPAVRAGRVPTASGYSVIPAVDDDTIAERLAVILRQIPGYTVVHCCDSVPPFGIIARAGADAVAADLGLLTAAGADELAEVLDGGLGLFAGVPSGAASGTALGAAEGPGGRSGQAGRSVGAGWSGEHRWEDTARTVADLWRRTGLDPRPVVVTPPCGLAGESPAGAVAQLRGRREAARILGEMMEEQR